MPNGIDSGQLLRMDTQDAGKEAINITNSSKCNKRKEIFLSSASTAPARLKLVPVKIFGTKNCYFRFLFSSKYDIRKLGMHLCVEIDPTTRTMAVADGVVEKFMGTVYILSVFLGDSVLDMKEPGTWIDFEN